MFRKRFHLLVLAWVACISTGCGDESFRAPPDCEGRRLVAFARRPVGGGTSDIFLYDYDGNGFHALPNLNEGTLSDVHPSLSLDGRFVAFERELSATESDVHLYDRCQDLIVPQPNLNSVYRESQPAFSGNGQRLAFVRDTLGESRLRLYDGIADRLIDLPALGGNVAYADSAPALNASGTVIAFVSTRNGNTDIFVYDLVGDSLRTLPDLVSTGSDVDPSLTPDGRYLAFASTRSGGAGLYDLYVYDLSTRAFVALAAAVNTAQNERAPSIDVTGERIAFESDRTPGLGGMDLYLYSRSTSFVERLFASGSANDVGPSLVWQ